MIVLVFFLMFSHVLISMYTDRNWCRCLVEAWH